MVSLPENVMAAFKDQKSVKVLTSVSADGQPHSIVCGSIQAVAPDMLIVGEVLMRSTAANLAKNDKAAILLIAGLTSFSVNVKAKQRVTEGPIFDEMNKALAAMHLKANAVWLFEPTAVFDQSANPNAGKKLA
ncbi:MAG: pyridoxamine 5'-phosphate oxidase family protein [Methanomassiliicoccaceae archaeon]|nr:pyridoxamine 5'-phosphate oxidase family protein [Methanomassiliicoccaceae archaeon]